MDQNSVPPSHPSHRPTFRDHLEALREENAARAFTRGKLASDLRHYAAARSQRKSARTLSRLKQSALRAAVEIAPHVVRVGMDDEFQIGLLSIVFPGRGRLHLPTTCLDSAA